MKKILLYTDTPIAGGAEEQMLLLAKFLNKKNYSPTLCCSDFPQLKEWQNKFKKNGIEVIKLKVKHKHDPRHFTQLKKILKQFDLLHCHIWNPAGCRYALHAAKKLKVATVITEHDPFPLPFFKNLIKKWQLKNVKKIIHIAESGLKTFLESYPEQQVKSVVIHNGIDIEDFEKKLNESPKNTSENKTISCVAALHKRKGINYLIEAFKKLPQSFKDYQLQLVGSGPDEAEFKKQALGLNIEFLGQRSDIPQILKNSDFFVLPSMREGFGLAVLEAMCAKLPILATYAGGIPEIISSDEYGILVEPQNSEALKNGLEKLLKLTEEEKLSMTKSAYERLKNHFSAKKMAEETEKVYDDTIRTS